ncbi:protein of unknown function DUF574 [Actinobacteria bacterium OK074]|nr:protein of unknown function DUF574 [Actinobacteria bacterium OK074]
MTDTGFGAGRIDTSKPHSARMYDYYLGGKDNYPVDWEAADKVIALLPETRNIARANREFMHRAARFVAERGVDQFLDVGTGIPTAPNLHQVVQEVTPAARVVYADNDPIVLRHAEALLHSTPEGRTAYVHADVRDPGQVLAYAREHLDFDRPVALSLVSLLHFVTDDADPYGIVRQLLEPLAPGSYFVVTHVAGDVNPEVFKKTDVVYHKGGIQTKVRSRDEFQAFLDGLELCEPGVVTVPRWRPDDRMTIRDERIPMYGAVARKP